MHHNPCFNLSILLNNPFDNQGSEINKNDIFLRFNILSFTKTFFLLIYIYICMYIYMYVCIFAGANEPKRAQQPSMRPEHYVSWITYNP